MPAPGVLLAALAACAGVVLLPLRRALALLVATIVLVPATLVVPNGVTSLATFPRVALLAFSVRLLLDLWAGRVDAAAFRPGRVHVAFGVFLWVTLMGGVVLADPWTLGATATGSWLTLVDQFVTFVVVLAAVRALGDRWYVATVLVVVIAASAAIGVAEHVVGSSWARWWFSGLPSQRDTLGAVPLEIRGNAVRVRGAAEFALEYGWMLAMVFPVVIAVAANAKRRLVLAVPFLVVLATLWSYTRTATAGLAFGAVVLGAAAVRNTRARAAFVVAVLGAATLWLNVPSLRQPFDAANQSGSVEYRQERLPVIFDAVADRPYGGLGLDSLERAGIPTTDASYLLVYAEAGVVGLLSLSVLLASVVMKAAGGLRAPPGRDRLLAGAVLAGLVAGLVAAASFDLFSVLNSGRLYWVLAAFAVALADAARADDNAAVTAEPSPARLAIPVVAVAVGLAVRALVPSHATVHYRFDTVSPVRLAAGGSDQVYMGDVFVRTACDAVLGAAAHDDATVECWPIRNAGPGAAQVRIEAPDAARLADITSVVEDARRTAVGPGSVAAFDEVVIGRPTWAETLPLTGSLAGIAAAALLPVRRWRRPGGREVGPDPAAMARALGSRT